MSKMKHLLWILIALLSLSLALQNTCPQGFAGKSSAAPTCGHCPHKPAHAAGVDLSVASLSAHSTAHPPMFLLDIPDTQPTFRLDALQVPQPVIPNTYKNTSPDELLQPPRA